MNPAEHILPPIPDAGEYDEPNRQIDMESMRLLLRLTLFEWSELQILTKRDLMLRELWAWDFKAVGTRARGLALIQPIYKKICQRFDLLNRYPLQHHVSWLQKTLPSWIILVASNLRKDFKDGTTGVNTSLQVKGGTWKLRHPFSDMSLRFFRPDTNQECRLPTQLAVTEFSANDVRKLSCKRDLYQLEFNFDYIIFFLEKYIGFQEGRDAIQYQFDFFGEQQWRVVRNEHDLKRAIAWILDVENDDISIPVVSTQTCLRCSRSRLIRS